MNKPQYACVPSADGICEMVTTLALCHEPSVLAGVKAAEDWLNSVQQLTKETSFMFSFECMAQKSLEQPLAERQPFKIGYALRLEQRLLSLSQQSMIARFNNILESYLDSLYQGMGKNTNDLKIKAFARVEQAYEFGLLTFEQAEKWRYQVLNAVNVGEIKDSLKKSNRGQA